MVSSDDVLNFWLEEVGPEKWYVEEEALDEEIRQRFMATWQDGVDGKLCGWMSNPRSALAYVILLDQFPRNMFRGQGKAFASDAQALAAAKSAIDHKWDMKIDEPARQFFYMPLMHSENLCDQDRCVRLMCERMQARGAGNLLHAKAHREVIRKFGRFPFRNNALKRAFTRLETEFLANGGYGKMVQTLQAA